MDTFFKEDGCFCLVVRDAFYQKITIAEYVWAPFILFFFFISDRFFLLLCKQLRLPLQIHILVRGGNA